MSGLGSRLEAVAHAWFGDQLAGVGGFGLQLLAEFGQVEAQVVGLGVVGGAPDLLEDLLAGDQAAGVADEDFQDGPFGLGEVYPLGGVGGAPGVRRTVLAARSRV